MTALAPELRTAKRSPPAAEERCRLGRAVERGVADDHVVFRLVERRRRAVTATVPPDKALAA